MNYCSWKPCESLGWPWVPGYLFAARFGKCLVPELFTGSPCWQFNTVQVILLISSDKLILCREFPTVLGHLAQASPGVTGHEQRQKPKVAGLVPPALKCSAHPWCQMHPKHPPDRKCYSSCFISIESNAQSCTSLPSTCSTSQSFDEVAVRLKGPSGLSGLSLLSSLGTEGLV